MNRYRFILLGLILGSIYLLIEMLLDIEIQNGNSGLFSYFSPDEPLELIHRFIGLFIIFAVGLLAFIADNRGKKMELALQEGRDIYISLAESVFSGILIHHQGTIVEANDRVASLFGYGRSTLVGMSTLELVSSEDRPKVSLMMDEQREEPYEVTGMRADGSTFEMEVLSNNITYMGRQARISALRDITHIKSYTDLLGMKRDGEDLLLDITSMFLARDDIDHITSMSLERFGKFTGACRVQLFELVDEGDILDNTHEWCAPGYPSMKEKLCGIETERFHEVVEHVRKANDPRDLPVFNPDLLVEERGALELIRNREYAYVHIPLYSRKGFAGFLSMEYPEDSNEDKGEQTMLRQIYSSILEIILDRKQTLDNRTN